MNINEVSRFSDDLCAINDGHDILTSFRNICPKELQPKAEHDRNHASFWDLNIKIEDSTFA